MKEPGQIAHRAFYTALHMTDVHIDNTWRHSETREGWAAVEAACRAEGMREAAEIAKGVGAAHRISGYSNLERVVLVEVYERILSAIGERQ